MAISYKEAGVDTIKADLFVDRIKKMVGRTYNEKVTSGVGGFASLYEIDKDRYLVSGTDGVGTKLKIAQQLNRHDTIGIDLVAMCVNDVLCTGARPLFFLDYFACDKLDIKVGSEILEGIVEGCVQSSMALVGGETAEMPGLYSPHEYDLAGFAVGEVNKSDLIDGLSIQEGDEILGIASSGFHSNGFSLIRKLINSDEKDLLAQVLTPTRIYVKLVQGLRQKFGKHIKGIAHITGSGFENIPRMSDKFDYQIERIPHDNEIPNFMSLIMKRSGLSKQELSTTFNMGVGLVLISDQGPEVLQHLKGINETAWKMGVVRKGFGNLINLF